MLDPERGLTSEWSFLTRELLESLERGKANGHG
jgi:hypothetical protein